ncbi:MAG: glycosyltransferase [Planctomycetes bacterium]|nr:glycosyltransferase [Planctomycetota bacterium]
MFAQGSFVHRGGDHRISEELWHWRLPVVSGLELRKHFHLPSLLRDVAALRGLIERDRYDLLHCHQPADHLIATLACRRLSPRPPIVRTLYEPEAPRRGLRERLAFARTAAVIAPTRLAAEAMRRRFGMPAECVLELRAGRRAAISGRRRPARALGARGQAPPGRYHRTDPAAPPVRAVVGRGSPRRQRTGRRPLRAAGPRQ